MSVYKTKIDNVDDYEIYQYTLDNNNGLVAEVINVGAVIKRLVFKGTDVVLGRKTYEEYLTKDGYFGAVVGRNCNRLEDAELKIDDTVYKLAVNQMGNHLHGGFNGFDKKIWTGREIDGAEPSVELTLISPDGDEGYPGEVKVKVTYTLTKDNSLKIHFKGESDADTALNLTNHSYFNLNGHKSGTIKDHYLKLYSSFYTPNTIQCQPYGEILCVKGTPFDFTNVAKIGEKMEADHEQMKMFNGLDHNFVLDGNGFRLAAELKGNHSGITMQVFTDRSGMQVCAGNYIDEKDVYKDNAKYPKYGGICLETQAFPNWSKFPHFPGGLLRKGEKYNTITEFKFF